MVQDDVSFTSNPGAGLCHTTVPEPLGLTFKPAFLSMAVAFLKLLPLTSGTDTKPSFGMTTVVMSVTGLGKESTFFSTVGSFNAYAITFFFCLTNNNY